MKLNISEFQFVSKEFVLSEEIDTQSREVTQDSISSICYPAGLCVLKLMLLRG